MAQVPSGVAWSLSRVGAEVSNRFARRLAPLGLTPSDVATLRAATRGDASQRELADRLSVAPSRMVVLLDSLEERELVTRSVDGDDRRRRVVTVTPRGRRLLEDVREIAAAHDAEIVAGLSADDIENLRGLLAVVQGTLDIAGPGHPGMS